MADASLNENTRQDPDFYLEDGNIVLAAKDSKNRTTYFRLHKSILVRNSPTFADMSAMPPPPSMDQHDGIPLVEMPDDANALRDFIAFLFDPKCVSDTLDHRDFTLKILEPALLAKKYQVDWICKPVQLLKRWPVTLEGWDAVENDEEDEEFRTQFGPWHPTWNDGTLRLRQFPEPVSSIRLARECDVPAILPFAFLHLLRTTSSSRTLVSIDVGASEDWSVVVVSG
ncbi:hypothetical protein DFH07DRAFT_953107 [Mycena maculata]|uniref:BTB domain-containing protein n=1 Tax=Mycena maculata TaxID=230809 RepID=A0AAD7JXL8_9AGAR|nr:hypothetical protein DFH07DRAFT_953107 [Mycena maculata]